MSGTRPTILVVDDTPAVLEVVCEMLAADHEVLFATEGQEALKLARAENPDLILLDVEMPGLDGFAVCAALKTFPETARIPVIFLTGLGKELDEARGLELGAVDYITKPCKPSILRARVKNHLELKRYRDELADQAHRDGLTGIANRRCLDESLAREWSRAVRAGQPLSLVMVDIDHFKRFNDRFGHVAGDVCIQRIAGALEEVAQRTGDLAARYGGEEFACLLPNTDAAGAAVLARRLQRNISALAIPDVVGGTFVSVSLGVATLLPRRDQLPEDLIVAADGFLYEAKRLGRNRLVGGSPGGREPWVVTPGAKSEDEHDEPPDPV